MGIDIRFVDTAVVFGMIGYLSALYQMGKLHWKDFKFWGEDVPREKRRNNLIGLSVVASVIGIRVLFAIYD